MVRICENGVFLENLRGTSHQDVQLAEPEAPPSELVVVMTTQASPHALPLWVYTSLHWDVAHDNGEGELNRTGWVSAQAAVELENISIHLQLPR